MTHDEARAKVSALIDGALEAREAEALVAHLDGCAACRADLARLRATVAILQEVEPVHAPEGFAAAVRGRIEQIGGARRPAREGLRSMMPPVRWSWKTAAAAAAAAVIGIFAVTLARETMPTLRRSIAVEDQWWRADTDRPLAGPSRAPDVPAKTGGGNRLAQAPAAGPAEPFAFRRVVRTGQVVLQVETVDDAARRLLAIAEGAGGFIADSSYADDGGTRRGTFTLRVPAARFGDAMRAVEELGTVQRRQVSGQDVTEEYVDLEARVRNLERQEARLLSFMDRATKIADLLAIESEVARVRGEIERLTGRLRFLANQVELATIRAEVSEKPKGTPGGFWDVERTLARIRTAFLNTVRQLLAAAEGLVAFVASLLPLALVAAAGWLVLRWSLRRAGRAA
ncbi:MAG: DUF4349 domain-containing protein [Armatimonadota bacterium]|nr:DUF4349 domain-containing protein [Armatimonadota bacterium]